MDNQLGSMFDGIWHDVINAISDPVVVKDEHHRWVLVNDAFCEVIGHSTEELLGKSDHDFFPKEQADVFWQVDNDIFANAKPITNRELLDFADGLTHIVSTKKEIIHDKDGNPYLVAIIRDITELVEAQESAELNRQAMADFLASMSHEIRTPMNGVLGMLELMDDSSTPTEQLPELIKTAYKSAKNLQFLLDDILDITKIQANELIVTVNSFSLQSLLDEVKSLFKATCIENKLDYKMSLDETLPDYIQTDKSRLRQIIINLVSNALKFTEQGCVEIQVLNVDNKSLQLIVLDTGPGLDENQLEMIFTPFKQGKQGLSSNAGGVGLGLSIAQKLSILLGGSICARNRLDVGCVFTLELPLIVGEQVDSPIVSERKQFVMKALVVDDHPTNIKVAQGMLKKFGVQSEALLAAHSVLDVCGKQKFDVIFMDIEMPEIDGYAATNMLRNEEGGLNQHTPIVAMTGHALVGYRDKCLAADMSDYITKPISFDSIQAVLDRVV